MKKNKKSAPRERVGGAKMKKNKKSAPRETVGGA